MNLKNKLWIILIIFIIAIGIGIYIFTRNNDSKKSNYSAQKTVTNQQNNLENNYNNNMSNSENTVNINTKNSIQNNTDNLNIASEPQTPTETTPKTEEVISSFSTKIYTKDSARQNNINITCSTLNETIVANGSTFSFCNTVGQATSAKGYQKADIFDNDGNKKKGLGGGNCQVSTTLYNAVLKVPNLTVTERHEHSNKVPYIANGKDAAVAYGSYDLKFKNNTGFDIKIKASSNGSSVDINLYKM